MQNPDYITIACHGYSVTLLMQERGNFEFANFLSSRGIFIANRENCLCYCYSGIILRGPDNRLCNCYPVVMSFMVDYPESCLIYLVRTNHACPVYMIPKQEFSCLDKKYPLRTVSEMQRVVAKALTLFSEGKNQKAEEDLKKYGLRGLRVCIDNIPISVRELKLVQKNVLFSTYPEYIVGTALYKHI